MAKRVYFCFHYQDVIDFRANVVRNHWVTKDRSASGFFDASLWEEAKKKGSIAVKRLINSGLDNTSATCVLIGDHTYARPWVRYEIFRSLKRGNRVFGVHINGIRGKDGRTKNLGSNPFAFLGITYSEDGSSLNLWEYKSKWLEYPELEGTASVLTKRIQAKYWGKGFKLSYFYPCYKWNKDNGFVNFPTWVGD